MKATPLLLLIAVLVFVGCATDPYKGQRRKDGTVPFKVQVETSDPGAKIEVNSDFVGEAPLTITIWGDDDGTFHGDGFTEIRANPVKAGQHVQVKRFANGGFFAHEDRIPSRLYFDLNLAPVREGPAIEVNVNNNNQNNQK